MEIKDRLIKIMNLEGLNSSSFADRVGVQRSSISHILSGRNKPSIDFLEKILSAYPKYHAEWLIMGTGEISKIPKQSSLFDSNSDEKIDTLVSSIVDNRTKTTQIETNITSSERPLNKQFSTDSLEKETDSITVPPLEIRKKEIERIVIFYTDQSFIEYLPGKIPPN